MNAPDDDAERAAELTRQKHGAGAVPRKNRSGSETRERGKVMGFRATAAERAEIRAGAERSGLTPSAYARARTLAAPQMRASRRPVVEHELLSRLLAQLGRGIGSLHQVAKKLNFGDIEYADQLPATLAEVKAAARAVKDALRGGVEADAQGEGSPQGGGENPRFERGKGEL